MHLALALLQSSSDNTSGAAAAGIFALIAIVYLVIFVVMMIVIIIPFWFICKKAGFSSWLALLNFVPFGTLILLYVLAFAEWKTLAQNQTQQLAPPPQQ
jgi:glycopeptide antibiotics resistance protein